MFDFSKKLVLFDRDGVLNENALVLRPEELRLLSNALRGIARLTRAGFRVGVCTNQGAIARGALDEAMLAQIHARLLLVVREFGGDIARIVFCASPIRGCCSIRRRILAWRSLACRLSATVSPILRRRAPPGRCRC